MPRKLTRKIKRNLVTIGVVAVLIVFGFFVTQGFVAVGEPTTEGDIILDFCTTEQECVNWMEGVGFSDSDIDEFRKDLNCFEGVCKVKGEIEVQT